jgi:hypothetical protein
VAKPISELSWKDLSEAQAERTWELGNARAVRYGETAIAAWMEWAKYLFAANTGAAAGLFLLSRSSDYRYWYLAAFSFFCGGVVFVGLSFFTHARGCHESALGWARDFDAVGRNEITFGQLDQRNLKRANSWKGRFARFCLVISFVCLIGGGTIAAKAFWSEPVKESVSSPK